MNSAGETSQASDFRPCGDTSFTSSLYALFLSCIAIAGQLPFLMFLYDAAAGRLYPLAVVIWSRIVQFSFPWRLSRV